MRRRILDAIVAIGLTFSPVRIAHWRLDPTPPPAAMLPWAGPLPELPELR